MVPLHIDHGNKYLVIRLPLICRAMLNYLARPLHDLRSAKAFKHGFIAAESTANSGLGAYQRANRLLNDAIAD
jgi:hypothetical protein